jgi:hypothetical protein
VILISTLTLFLEVVAVAEVGHDVLNWSVPGSCFVDQTGSSFEDLRSSDLKGDLDSIDPQSSGIAAIEHLENPSIHSKQIQHDQKLD